MNSKATILYVDDDYDDVLLMSEIFEKCTDHIRVVHACNGVEALGILAQMQEDNSLPGMIILDINMPIMDGKKTLEEIKRQESYKEIPVVLFTTSTNPKDKLFAADMGAGFVTKPARYSDMEILVKDWAAACNASVATRVQE